MRCLIAALFLFSCDNTPQWESVTPTTGKHVVDKYDVSCAGEWIDGRKVFCKSDCVVECYIQSTHVWAVRWNVECVPFCVVLP